MLDLPSMAWMLRNSKIPKKYQEVIELLLESRQINDSDNFFSPPHPLDLPLSDLQVDPTQVSKSLELLEEAHQQKHQVIVFGDYDADGVCATAIMWEALYALGFNVLPFIPDRHKHGYGLSVKSLPDVLSHQPSLVISVDNGIVAFEAVEALQKQGVKVIVTDHHLPEGNDSQLKLPAADGVVFTSLLCGASVAWIMAREIFLKFAPEKAKDFLTNSLDLAGIATVADQVILKSANRSFAYHGIKQLQKTTRLGLQELYQLAGVNQAEINEESINFMIAPRINALGRLGSGLESLKLLLTKNKANAHKLAHSLQATNVVRQDMTSDQLELALNQESTWTDEHLVISHSTEYHEGVIGLIAGRLMEKYHKPAIVMSVKDGIVKASARSIKGVNIVQLIREIKDDLLEVGGHPMAAGFGFKPEKLDTIQKKLYQLFKIKVPKEALERQLEIDLELPAELIDIELINSLTKFAPFGQGNPKFIFQTLGMKVDDVSTIGKDGQHLKLALLGDDGQRLTGLWWKHGSEKINQGDILDIAYSLEKNVWRDQERVQMIVKGIKNY